MYLSKEEIKKYINPHLFSILPFNNKHRVHRKDAIDLLSPQRFDILSKYIYIKNIKNEYSQEWALKIYREHLKAFGGVSFNEGDSSGKNSFEIYLRRFNTIINSIRIEGFKNDISLIPVGEGGVAIDGAHRIAACIYYNAPINVVEFDYIENIYDYSYFQNHGLQTIYMDQMALEYCRLKKTTKLAVLFPISYEFYDKVIDILNNYGDIVYEKSVKLTDIGKKNLIRQIYKGEKWIGKRTEETSGFLRHINERFTGKIPVTFIFIDAHSEQGMVEAKSIIRDICGENNNSIHINDTHIETIRLAEQVLNENSIEFWNNGRPELSRNFLKLFDEYKDIIYGKELNKDNFCIDAGGVLAIYGLRETGDLDFLTKYNGVDFYNNINNHNMELRFYNSSLNNLIFNPTNYFYYDGMKFLTLENVKKMKSCRNEFKDKRDVLLINNFISNEYKKFKFWRKKIYYEMIVFRTKWKSILKNSIKAIAPAYIWDFIKKVYNIPFHIKEIVGPYNREFMYKGFIVYYTRGMSLVEKILHEKTYEPEVTWQILNYLKRKNNKVFIDIGANIGLITLNVLHSFPDTKIFAFEPGPFQYDLFTKTIRKNDLTGKVVHYNLALSSKIGKSEFAIHDSKHSSGDGFFDTGRAGKTNTITVNVDTLDNWWVENNKLEVDVIDIDAEGSEYWILQGAKDFLLKCRPVLILEISEENVDVYPHDPSDLLNLLRKCNYILKTFGGIEVNDENLPYYINHTENFVALPK